MIIQTTSIYEQLAQAWIDKKRHIYLEGGTAASKTWSVLQLLYLIADHAKSPLLISCVSESIPHIKRGCLRDFQRILGDAFDLNRFNKTDLIYSFSQARLEFFSADDPSKQRGARRDILFLNELNNIPYDAYRELDARTRLCTIADWNPVSEFFFHEQQLQNDPDSCYIHATYRDALAVAPPEVIKNILAMGARDPNWANIYLEGRIGKIEGLVYPHFEQVNGFEGDIFYGLDFGFSNDPTALVRCMIRGDNLYSQELLFETGLTNQDIANRMLELGIRTRYDEIFADAAEPKSIEEIYRYGFNIKPAAKGQGSVEYGHQLIRQYKQYWAKDSLNGIKEQRNFRYIQDKNGKFTDKTTHNYSHLMDARRYAVVGKTEIEPIQQIIVYDSMELVRGIEL
jgi:phage terminase large subunit